MTSRQRVSAHGRVSSKRLSDSQDGVRSALHELYQNSSARIRFPQHECQAVQAVLMNTAGGLTGDDSLIWEAAAGQGSELTLTTAACEKVYRTHGPFARQKILLSVEDGARLFWLPQETIVFDGSALQRTIDVQLDEQARCVIAESLVLGRQAMDEHVRTLQVHDRWRIYLSGRLLHAEDFKLSSPQSLAFHHYSALHHYGAMATVLVVCSQSEEWFELMTRRLRALNCAPEHALTVAVSSLPKRLIVRVLACDSYKLREFLIPCIELLAEGEPIPRVWHV